MRNVLLFATGVWLVAFVASTAQAATGSSAPAGKVEPRKSAAPVAAEGSPSAGSPPVGEAADAPFIADGVLHSPRYGLQLPVASGWTLAADSNIDEMHVVSEECDGCMLRVLISPGNSLAIDETAREIKQEIFKDANTVIIDEEATRVAKERAYTIVKEEFREPPRKAPERGQASNAGPHPEDSAPPADATARIFTRYVTFNHAGDKYYVMIRAPRASFRDLESAFQDSLTKLRFRP